MNKKIWIAVIVVAIIAVVGWVTPVGKDGQTIVEKLGAISTLDGVDSPFITIAGLKGYEINVPMTATSSLLCSVLNPLNATSSIEYVSASVTARGGMSATSKFVVSTSTSKYATSSTNLIHDYTTGTGQFNAVMAKNVATSTASPLSSSGVSWGADSAGRSLYVLGPGQYINFLISTTSPGGGGTFSSYMTGTCSVGLKKI